MVSTSTHSLHWFGGGGDGGSGGDGGGAGVGGGGGGDGGGDGGDGEDGGATKVHSGTTAHSLKGVLVTAHVLRRSCICPALYFPS